MALLACSKSSSKSFAELDGCARRKFMVENNIMPVNRDVLWMNSSTVLIPRARNGYGFSVSGCAPVHVSRVDASSPAAAAGLRVNDCLVKINGVNVSRSAADSVAKIIRQSNKQIVVDIHRPAVGNMQSSAPPKTPTRRPLGTLVGPNSQSNQAQQQQPQLQKQEPLLSPYLVETAPRSVQSAVSSCLSDTRMAINGSAATLWSNNSSTDDSDCTTDDSWAFHDDSSLSLESYSARPPPVIQRPQQLQYQQPPRYPDRPLQFQQGQQRPAHTAREAHRVQLDCEPLTESTRCRQPPVAHAQQRLKRALPTSPDSSYGSQEVLDDTLISGNSTIMKAHKESRLRSDVSSSSSSNFADDESYDSFERGIEPSNGLAGRMAGNGCDSAAPIAYYSLSSAELERQAAVQKLIASEEKFMKTLTAGFDAYLRPLRQAVITKHEHNMLFQNIEFIMESSQRLLDGAKQNSVQYSDRDDDTYIKDFGAVLRESLSALCSEYELYCNGLKNAIALLLDLKEEKIFVDWVKKARKATLLSLSSFIQKPLEHVKELVLSVQAIARRTGSQHRDYAAIRKAVEGMRSCCSRINETHMRRSQSICSMASSSVTSSVNSHQTSGSSRSSPQCSDASQSSCSSSCSSSRGHVSSEASRQAQR